MRMLVFELYEGQASENLKTLMEGYQGIEFARMNLGNLIPDSEGIPMGDYFEYLHAAPTVFSAELIDNITRIILKEVRGSDYIMCPIGAESKGSVLGYVWSWIQSYTDQWGLRGTAYYVDKSRISEGASKALYESFINLFDFEKIVTETGDVLHLDMPDRHKALFKKIGVKLQK